MACCDAWESEAAVAQASHRVDEVTLERKCLEVITQKFGTTRMSSWPLTQCQTLQRAVQSSYSSAWWQLRMLPCKEFEYWQYEMFRTNIPIVIHPQLSSCYAIINNIGNSPLSWWDLTLELRGDFRLLLMSIVFTFLSLRFTFRCCTDERLCDEGKKTE